MPFLAADYATRRRARTKNLEKFIGQKVYPGYAAIQTVPASPSKPRRRGTMKHPRPLPLRASGYHFLLAPVVGQAFALRLFPSKFAGSPYCFSLFANLSLRRLLI